jgi:hypothetical protein
LIREFIESSEGHSWGGEANVEIQDATLVPTPYRELTGYYGFSPRAAETYKIHADEDEGHGGRQINAIRKLATDPETQNKVRAAVKLGLTAFTLEWDGHVQAMTGKREFWSGVKDLNLSPTHGETPCPQPLVRPMFFPGSTQHIHLN